MKAKVYLTPIPFGRADLESQTVVVVDVLRCTTSMCAALKAGARGIIPVSEPGEATDIRTKIGPDAAVLAGERQGVRIEGFQLGNSPSEFTPEAVADKLVIMTTTNGTRAFRLSLGAGRVYAGAVVNAAAVAARLAEGGGDVTVVCAGREGQFSIEDTLCAGMLLHLLQTRHNCRPELNDASALALLLYRHSEKALRATIAQGEHGRFLTSIGFGSDIDLAAGADTIPVVPVLRDERLVLEND